jgi:acyl-CoA synthetase (AMP-forming)/AMP-acid ligase II
MADRLQDAATFWELVERRARLTPDDLMFVDERDRRMTFGEFRDRAERVAAGLHDLGITPGTSVTWQLPTRIESVLVSVALARLGAVQTPILHIYRDREVGFVLRQQQSPFYVCPGVWRDVDFPKMAADAGTGATVVVAYDELPEGDPSTLPPPPDDGDAVRWIYFTSGTTSDPKGVQHTDRTLIAGGYGLAHAVDMGPGDVGSMVFPFAHIAGPDYLVMMLIGGCSAMLMEAFVIGDAIPLFARNDVTMAGGSTAFYLMYLAEQRKQPGTPIIPTLKYLSGGGAPKPPEIFYEVQREMGIRTLHGYGMTECPMISQGSPRDTDEQLANTEGAPVSGCEITIVDADENVCPAGDDGEVRLRGPMVCKGYTDPELTKAAFDDEGRFRTGDLGHLRDDGHIVLTGRLKDVIIRKGENVSAKEIEDVLYEHPKVKDVAVIGVPDRERGEMVCAVVEPAEGVTDALTLDEVVAHCRAAGLMMQKIPERLELVDALPRNNTLNKILKYKLREQFGA